MISAVLDKQLMVTVDNKVGALAEITNVVSSSGINLIAVCAYTIDRKGFIIFVSENNKKARKLLEANKYNVREEEIVLVSLGNKPGALQSLSKAIAAAGIDVALLYGSVGKQNKSARLVVASEDNQGVLSVIRLMK